eukprot:5437120-Amphidinium_carterae.1
MTRRTSFLQSDQSRATNKLLQRTVKKEHVQQEKFWYTKRFCLSRNCKRLAFFDDEAWLSLSLSDAQSSETGPKGGTQVGPLSVGDETTSMPDGLLAGGPVKL